MMGLCRGRDGGRSGRDHCWRFFCRTVSSGRAVRIPLDALEPAQILDCVSFFDIVQNLRWVREKRSETINGTSRIHLKCAFLNSSLNLGPFSGASCPGIIEAPRARGRGCARAPFSGVSLIRYH